MGAGRFVFFFAAATVAAVSMPGDTIFAGAVRENAERYATRYGSRMEGMRAPVAECMGVDSDDNGYVTCTVRDSDRELGDARPHQIECRANVVFEFDTGCREYRLRTIDVRTGEAQ